MTTPPPESTEPPRVPPTPVYAPPTQPAAEAPQAGGIPAAPTHSGPPVPPLPSDAPPVRPATEGGQPAGPAETAGTQQSGYAAPQNGAAQYPGPQYGTPHPGAPHYGAPQYGQPQYGTPPYGQPQYQAPGTPYGTPADPLPNLTANYWLSVFFLWVPALIFFLVESPRATPQVRALHAANLNFALIRSALFLFGWVLLVIPVIGSAFVPLAHLLFFIFHIMAAAKASDTYRRGGGDPFIFNIPMVR